jgi:hypothetical protein
MALFLRHFLSKSGEPHPVYARAWDRILGLPVDEIAATLIDPPEHARALRHVTPFPVDENPEETPWSVHRERNGYGLRIAFNSHECEHCCEPAGTPENPDASEGSCERDPLPARYDPFDAEAVTLTVVLRPPDEV